MITFAPRLTTESQQASGFREFEGLKIKLNFFSQTLVKKKNLLTFATPKGKTKK
jgi:hypothetical protein